MFQTIKCYIQKNIWYISEYLLILWGEGEQEEESNSNPGPSVHIVD